MKLDLQSFAVGRDMMAATLPNVPRELLAKAVKQVAEFNERNAEQELIIELERRLRAAEAELISTRNYWSELHAKTISERDTIAEQFKAYKEAAEGQKPVGRIWDVDHLGNSKASIDADLQEGDLLYTRPIPSQQAVPDDSALKEFADEVKQLCSDFSDQQNRPYMGDVTDAIDGLYEKFADRCQSGQFQDEIAGD